MERRNDYREHGREWRGNGFCKCNPAGTGEKSCLYLFQGRDIGMKTIGKAERTREGLQSGVNRTE